MYNSEVWYNQDALKLSVEEWVSLLENPNIFDQNAKDLLFFAYAQPNNKATATQIGEKFNISQQKVAGLNRSISNKIFKFYNVKVPPNSEGGRRYWNVIFDGVPECPTDEKGHFFWRIRKNLILAIETISLLP